MSSCSQKKNTTSLIKATVVVAVVSALTACGIAAPKTEIAYAEAMLQSARNIGANEFSGVELERAKNKLQRAKEEMKDGNNEKALRLANESTADSSLAQAKTEAGKASAAEKQMQKSMQMLKSQLK
ncbi:conserved hypothetical protein [Bathymodiolus platifrons methanotrophic gill symbiont]|uniref:DUF4398 domain-containing protein n=1 Tax=Bathymodiolus platifrons methanotrophic gill symbiont TaxID=113268 RepID=UPI000B753E68|nr:DUF4398 domain-containing protein [Bathymodiolus platifrons methanotrophic gill symbiont]TXL12111.1 hypothetical protein BMR08_00910 [Methylococcaceae bacterium CS2]GAW85258.1 conserved hypothetical protein [Bathymodiolus platifrons methanotrophic gill symbiont]